MKTIFRLLSLGVLAFAFMAAGSVAALAQDPCTDTESQTKLQEEIRAKYNSKEIKPLEEAIAAGKQLLEKYGTCQFSAEFIAWLKPKIPLWEKRVAEMKTGKVRSEILGRFDDGIKAKNWDAVYTAGNEFVTKFPDDPAYINIAIPMGMIGLYESFPPAKNYKYNNDTLKYAKIAIEKLKAGVKPTKESGGYGAFQFECKKDDCINQLTYSLGYITYYGQGNKQGGLPYLYETTKLPGTFKDNPAIYGTFGDYYYEDVKKLADEVQVMIKAQADSDTPEVKAKKEADIKAKIAILNGYAERAMDAYSRAYKLTKDTDKTYKDNIYKTIQALYNVRFPKQDGLDQWIATTVTKPLPDPTSKVDPISDPEPTTTTTTTGTAPATASPASTAPAKPATTATPKPAAPVKSNGKTGSAPDDSSTAVKAKAPAAKPAPVKKKGTR